MILHRIAMRLALPAGERRAVVSDDQFQSAHHDSRRKRREDACALQKLPRNSSNAFDEFRTECFGSAMRLRVAFLLLTTDDPTSLITNRLPSSAAPGDPDSLAKSFVPLPDPRSRGFSAFSFPRHAMP